MEKGEGKGREGGQVNVRYAFTMYGTVTMNVRYPFRMYGTVTMKSVCQMQRPIRGKMPVIREREREEGDSESKKKKKSRIDKRREEK